MVHCACELLDDEDSRVDGKLQMRLKQSRPFRSPEEHLFLNLLRTARQFLEDFDRLLRSSSGLVTWIGDDDAGTPRSTGRADRIDGNAKAL